MSAPRRIAGPDSQGPSPGVPIGIYAAEALRRAPLLSWRFVEGDHISAPLSVSSNGDYVISHRSYYTLSYRRRCHVHVGTFKNLQEAMDAAERHYRSLTASTR